MIKILKWLLLAATAFLMQTQLSSMHISVNITVVLVYFFGLKNLERVSTREYFGSKAEIQSTLFGAITGLAEDAIMGSVIGPNLLSKGLIGFITPVIFADVVFRWTRFWGMMILITFTFLDGAIVIGSRAVFTDLNINVWSAFLNMLVQAVINVPFGMLLKPKAVN
jgi:cell shape-determining protein MreD